MAELKTKKTKASVISFLKGIEPEKKRSDGLLLKKLFDKVTGKKAAMWGDSIVGYGVYHYKSERSGQEGDWPLIGFSPRKQNISIYLMPGVNKYRDRLSKLGKFKTSSGSCFCTSINWMISISRFWNRSSRFPSGIWKRVCCN